MYVYALFCLLALANANPLHSHVEPGSHIVIVTPQAQVHLEPALRYVHGLSPLARVAAPHHEETIVYVPAGTAASVLPVVDSVGSGRATGAAIAPDTKQIEQIGQNIEQIQQQVQQGAESWGGQFSDASNAAAAAAAAAGAGFFPSFYPPSGNIKKEEQKLKTEKIELIETPANTQPLLTATEARHFYTLPQVYHTPVVDVVHAPVYLTPISAIRARSIQPEQSIELKAEEPQLEQPLEPQLKLQPLQQKAEFAGRLLEANALKQELQNSEIAKEPVKEEAKPQNEPLIKAALAEPLEQQQQQPQPAESIPLAPQA
ncbi:uncharacterized protein LOC115632720 [Scaptodrosophila lebanonensis]|uniref:Uncharacterized protein LOC115632720 n=1 Tax=Drosophila lebanonensis TaxID=7225 RepID=A0A6J2UBH1_DROLE|nr:uncharacterized protein LOC115632720 [Scaptodrosophila lebanonensis]